MDSHTAFIGRFGSSLSLPSSAKSETGMAGREAQWISVCLCQIQSQLRRDASNAAMSKAWGGQLVIFSFGFLCDSGFQSSTHWHLQFKSQFTRLKHLLRWQHKIGHRIKSPHA